jgi:hypothetical protein
VAKNGKKGLKQPQMVKIHVHGAVLSTKKVHMPYLGDL